MFLFSYTRQRRQFLITIVCVSNFNLLTSEDELTRPENVLLPSQDAYIRRHLHDREYRPKYRPSSTGCFKSVLKAYDIKQL